MGISGKIVFLICSEFFQQNQNGLLGDHTDLDLYSQTAYRETQETADAGGTQRVKQHLWREWADDFSSWDTDYSRREKVGKHIQGDSFHLYIERKKNEFHGH